MTPEIIRNDLDDNGNPAGGRVRITDAMGNTDLLNIVWQAGPIKEVGENGVQCEDVIAAVKQRLEFFQDYFPCDENADAIAHAEEMLAALNSRTARRVAQGVEGTSMPGDGDHPVDTLGRSEHRDES